MFDKTNPLPCECEQDLDEWVSAISAISAISAVDGGAKGRSVRFFRTYVSRSACLRPAELGPVNVGII